MASMRTGLLDALTSFTTPVVVEDSTKVRTTPCSAG